MGKNGLVLANVREERIVFFFYIYIHWVGWVWKIGYTGVWCDWVSFGSCYGGWGRAEYDWVKLVQGSRGKGREEERGGREEKKIVRGRNDCVRRGRGAGQDWVGLQG